MKVRTIFAIGLLLLSGCSGSSEQKQAYVDAYKFEQDNVLYGGVAAPYIILKYQGVIRLDPDSKIAKDAQKRIDITQKNWSDYKNLQQQRMNQLMN